MDFLAPLGTEVDLLGGEPDPMRGANRQGDISLGIGCWASPTERRDSTLHSPPPPVILLMPPIRVARHRGGNAGMSDEGTRGIGGPAGIDETYKDLA